MNSRFIILILFIAFSISLYAQKISITVANANLDKVSIYSISGEKATLIDSILPANKNKIEFIPANYHIGVYRAIFNKKNSLDFIYDGKDIVLMTDDKNFSDSLKVLTSESNSLYHSFLKLNRAYREKTELLQLILVKYPHDDPFYATTRKRFNEIQNEYIKFVNVTSQKDPRSFVAKYIRSAQLPIIDYAMPLDKQLTYLKAHALDNVDFNNTFLTNSNLYTDKAIQYLIYFRNQQLPKESLEKEFMPAVDSLLNRAKVNQIVYQQIVEYLINGFKQYGFDFVIDYIVSNYVIKDDLCLDVKTEGLIKRRIDQAKIFKVGSIVPDINSLDLMENKVALNQLSAEKILIVFYASWCPHCKELLPKLNDLVKNQKVKKVDVLAVSLDEKKDDWVNFVKENCSSLLNVSDLKGWNGKAANDYYIYATPSMFLIDRQKKIIGKPMTFDDVRVNF